jgi:alkylhydroperoxidase family enzyme
LPHNYSFTASLLTRARASFIFQPCAKRKEEDQSMEPMYLKDVEEKPAEGAVGEMIERMKAQGAAVPQIWHLFAFKPDITQHLADFTQGVMRGPSPLSPGQRELIAAFTSRRNDCPF